MNCIKLKIVTLIFILICVKVDAQKDTRYSAEIKTKKQWQMGKFNLPKIKMPVVKLPTVKMPSLKWPKKSEKTTQRKKINFNQFFTGLDKNAFSFSSGINFSKQTISGIDYTFPFNYDVNKINNDVYKPGYFISARWDGMLKNKHMYNLELGLQRISSGTKYNTTTTLDPFIGEFVQHKAENQFFILNIGANYKKQIPFKNSEKFKLYTLIGPSFDIRLSNQSIHNRVTNSYTKILMRANLGLEFDNNGYYTIFMHYKPSITSFTKQPITTTLNSFELGMMLNANDIF